MSIPKERTTDYQKQQREAGDNAGQNISRIRWPRAHYSRAAISTKPRCEDGEQATKTYNRHDNHRAARRTAGSRAIKQEDRADQHNHCHYRKEHRDHGIAAREKLANHLSIALERSLYETKR